MMYYWYTTNCIIKKSLIFHHGADTVQERRCFEKTRMCYLNLLTFFMVFSLWNFDPEQGYRCISQYFSHKAFFKTGIHRDTESLSVTRSPRSSTVTRDFKKAFKGWWREVIPTGTKLNSQSSGFYYHSSFQHFNLFRTPRIN